MNDNATHAKQNKTHPQMLLFTNIENTIITKKMTIESKTGITVCFELLFRVMLYTTSHIYSVIAMTKGIM